MAEAAAIEGASRWYFFRRITFPLLMPTTLFVLVNAVINSFRLVDHIVVMTRGGPDNTTALLLFYIYEVGFKFWDTAYAATLDGRAVGDARRCWRSASSYFSSAGFTTNERLRRPQRPRPAALETAGAWLLGAAVDPAARLRALGRDPSERLLGAFRPQRSAYAGKFRQGLERSAVCALFPQHVTAGDA